MYIEANVSVEDIAAAVGHDGEAGEQVILGITENFPQDFTTGIIDVLIEASYDEGAWDDIYAVVVKWKDMIEERRAF
jgi:hypothetical protein